MAGNDVSALPPVGVPRPSSPENRSTGPRDLRSCIHPRSSLLFLRELRTHSTEFVVFLDAEKTVRVTPQTVERLHGKVAAEIFTSVGKPTPRARAASHDSGSTGDGDQERERRGSRRYSCERWRTGPTTSEDSRKGGDPRRSRDCSREQAGQRRQLDCSRGTASSIDRYTAISGGGELTCRGRPCRVAGEDTDAKTRGEAEAVERGGHISLSEKGTAPDRERTGEKGSRGDVRGQPSGSVLEEETPAVSTDSPDTKPRIAESFHVSRRQERGSGDRCWCHDVEVMEGTLTIPSGVAGPGESVDERIHEHAAEAAAVLQRGSTDALAVREGLVGRAFMQCHFLFDSTGSCKVWPTGVIDPAEEILKRQRQALVAKRLLDSVPPSVLAKLTAETPPIAAGASDETLPMTGKCLDSCRGGTQTVSSPNVMHLGDKMCVSVPSQVEECDSQGASSVAPRIREPCYDGSLWARFRSVDAANRFLLLLESVPSERQRSGTPGGPSTSQEVPFETLLMQQLLFMLWGPPDATFSTEVLTCRPSIWRPLLGACPQCKGHLTDSQSQDAADRAGERCASPDSCPSAASFATGVSTYPRDSGDPRGITVYPCTCSRFRSCILPLTENEVATYLQEDMLLLPDSELNDSEQDGKARKRLVQYAFTASSEDGGSSDSWDYDPSSTSSSSDEENFTPPSTNSSGAVDLPVSAPRRWLDGRQSSGSVPPEKDSTQHVPKNDEHLLQAEESVSGSNGPVPSPPRSGTDDAAELPVPHVRKRLENDGGTLLEVTRAVEGGADGEELGVRAGASSRRSELSASLSPGLDVVDGSASAPRRHLANIKENCGSSSPGRSGASNSSTSTRKKKTERSLKNAAPVTQFREKIEKAISFLGGSCVPFLNYNCPTDARWMVAGATFANRGFGTTCSTHTNTSMAFACSHAWEVLLLLKSSQKIGDCLNRPLHGCTDLVPCESPGVANKQGGGEPVRSLNELTKERVCKASKKEATTCTVPEAEELDDEQEKKADGCLQKTPSANCTAECHMEQKTEGLAAGGPVDLGTERDAEGGAKFHTAVTYWTRHRIALSLWTRENREAERQPWASFPISSNPGSSTIEVLENRCAPGGESGREHDTQHGAPEQVPVYNELCLVETKRLEEGLEFRCFVAGNRLLGISQRFPQDIFPFLVRKPVLQEDVRRAIVAFFENTIVRPQSEESILGDVNGFRGDAQLVTSAMRQKNFLRRYVFDVYLQRKKTAKERADGFKCWVLNVLPWGGATDSLLFTWDELRRIAYTPGTHAATCHPQRGTAHGFERTETTARDEGSCEQAKLIPELRIVETQDQTHAGVREGALQLPKELLDIAAAGSLRGSNDSLERLLSDLQAAHADILSLQKSRPAKQGQADLGTVTEGRSTS
ncbi:cell division cycle protein 123 [Cystoisospora suis]|uniref:Cell division cycle protein 123 n=1 Tax=Cystoisospora suis TaxID=483139 RepID=A0A2C6LDX7_9APIC|nr:cell division cycle protein 123 [Cystoisospora suis]